MSLNVNPDVEDVYYRYKMPKINVKVEGKGNGIKTVITNMGEIAKSIYRKPSYPIKYFGIELGSQTNIDDKNEKYVVNGAHDGIKLQETLYNFIKKFVLCNKCGNPETTLTIKKKSEKIVTKCKACGENGSLDMKHKLTQYIMKNPPENESEGAPPPKTVEELNELRQQEFDLAENMDMSLQVTMPKELDKPAEVPSAKTIKSDNDTFFETVTEKFRNGTLLEDRKQIIQMCKRLKLKESCVMILMEVVFVNSAALIQDIIKYSKLFQLFTRIGPNREKYQHYVLTGMILLCDKFKIYKYAGHFLFYLYQNDVIEEDVILEWHEKGPSKKYCSKVHSQEILDACNGLVEWLKSAEEEPLNDENMDMNGDDDNGMVFNNGGGSYRFRSNIVRDDADIEDEEYDPDEEVDINDI